MARMYSRKRGKAGSKKPLKKTKPTWLTHKPKEIEILITRLAKDGKTSSEIGIIMRDTYGVPDVKTLSGKRITKILEEKKLLKEIPEDLLALIKKSVLIKKHLDENHKDMPALRGLQLTESKIKRLVKFYKSTTKLPLEWKYDPKSVKMYIE